MKSPMKKILCSILSLPFFFALSACSMTETDAPVVEGWKQTQAASSRYRVQKEDTIYSVAWAFGMDYHTLIELNHLKAPYRLSPGQTLRMSSGASGDTYSSSPASTSATTYAAGPISTPTSYVDESEPAAVAQSTVAPVNATVATSAASTEETTPAVQSAQSATATGNWLWPTQGTVVRHFSAAAGGGKGLDISGHLGQPVLATAKGKVVYTGASLAGYGNLIIIKHTDAELSAYAFNKVIAVKEGEMVQAGQTIARMGKNESGKPILHFEIRKNGKPVDPMAYLASKS
jgi:lipoprotein NlpD